jgi:hypothetical protein
MAETFLKVPVEIAKEQPEHQWRGADGRLYTPGDVIERGYIVDAEPGALIGAGVVWIAADKLPEAEAAGWRPNGQEAHDGAIVQVERQL